MVFQVLASGLQLAHCNVVTSMSQPGGETRARSREGSQGQAGRPDYWSRWGQEEWEWKEQQHFIACVQGRE